MSELPIINTSPTSVVDQAVGNAQGEEDPNSPEALLAAANLSEAELREFREIFYCKSLEM
jgi:hypothetical protein